MNKRKAQAALEFIMTYGWAILVVLVAIGALAYFGVLSPDRFLPNKCALQAGIACIDSRATSSGLTTRITNSLGYDISAVNVSAGSCGTSNSPSTLANSASATYTISCNLTSGSKYNAQFNISYTVTDTGISHLNAGQITTRVE